MKILLISKDGAAFDLGHRLQQEGHEVSFAIKDRDYTKVGDGFGLRKVKDWEAELPWVGKDGLIIFDQNGWGYDQAKLRRSGYSVLGGSEGGDKLEFNRKHAQDIFKNCGMKTVRSRHFCSADEAIKFVKKTKGRWVVKQNGHIDKCFAYAGRRPDGNDVVDLLQNYKTFNNSECASIDLQECIIGIEIGVARYFNGKDWVGPIEMNIEHKSLFPGGYGPKTDEMGTVVWYDDNEDNKLFVDTLLKLRGYLRKIDFRGDIDINCIVNEQGAFPLEATPRFGYPALHAQCTLNRSPWGEFLKAVADGREYNLKWKKGYCIVVLVAAPPFPYSGVSSKYSPEGLKVYTRQGLTEDERNCIHWSEIARIPTLEKGGKGGFSDNAKSSYVVAGKSGYVLCVTGHDKSIQKASSQAYGLTEKLCLPRMFYRNDIGKKFIEHDRALLKKWGYV